MHTSLHATACSRYDHLWRKSRRQWIKGGHVVIVCISAEPSITLWNTTDVINYSESLLAFINNANNCYTAIILFPTGRLLCLICIITCSGKHAAFYCPVGVGLSLKDCFLLLLLLLLLTVPPWYRGFSITSWLFC